MDMTARQEEEGEYEGRWITGNEMERGKRRGNEIVSFRNKDSSASSLVFKR